MFYQPIDIKMFLMNCPVMGSFCMKFLCDVLHVPVWIFSLELWEDAW